MSKSSVTSSIFLMEKRRKGLYTPCPRSYRGPEFIRGLHVAFMTAGDNATFAGEVVWLQKQWLGSQLVVPLVCKDLRLFSLLWAAGFGSLRGNATDLLAAQLSARKKQLLSQTFFFFLQGYKSQL